MNSRVVNIAEDFSRFKRNILRSKRDHVTPISKDFTWNPQIANLSLHPFTVHASPTHNFLKLCFYFHIRLILAFWRVLQKQKPVIPLPYLKTFQFVTHNIFFLIDDDYSRYENKFFIVIQFQRCDCYLFYYKSALLYLFVISHLQFCLGVFFLLSFHTNQHGMIIICNLHCDVNDFWIVAFFFYSMLFCGLYWMDTEW